jgi:hypothetical protein
MKNLNNYSNNHQNTFQQQEKFLEWYFITCVNLNKISIMSLINDLGINKVPKENKNKNNTFQKFGRYYFKVKSTIWI